MENKTERENKKQQRKKRHPKGHQCKYFVSFSRRNGDGLVQWTFTFHYAKEIWQMEKEIILGTLLNSQPNLISNSLGPGKFQITIFFKKKKERINHVLENMSITWLIYAVLA